MSQYSSLEEVTYPKTSAIRPAVIAREDFSNVSNTPMNVNRTGAVTSVFLATFCWSGEPSTPFSASDGTCNGDVEG